MLVLTQDDVRRLLDLDELIEALADAFAEVSAGRASVPPRVAAVVPERGLLAAMPGYAAGVLVTKLVSRFKQCSSAKWFHARSEPSPAPVGGQAQLHPSTKNFNAHAAKLGLCSCDSPG